VARWIVCSVSFSDTRIAAYWSPARRAIVSCGLSSRERRRESVSRIESPAERPTVSLICLKRSTSMQKTVGRRRGSFCA
jgi:hypothetical protein